MPRCTAWLYPDTGVSEVVSLWKLGGLKSDGRCVTELLLHLACDTTDSAAALLMRGHMLQVGIVGPVSLTNAG